MRHLTAALTSAVLLTAILNACATARPGTGDISFRLLWDGSADLDLHAEDPHGRHVGTHMNPVGAEDVAARQAQFLEYERLDQELAHLPKGILDVDCNADPARMCKRPMENLYWPEGTAPRGSYRVWVHHFQDVEGDGDPVPYVLEVRRGERVVRTVRGSVGPEQPTSEPLEISY